MFKDDLFVLGMSRDDSKNFIGFGYVAKADLDIFNTSFNKGYIYRFAIFCNELGEIRIEVIKKHYYAKNQYKSFYQLAHKLEDNNQYTEYSCNSYGYPNLDKNTILRYRRYM